MGRGAEALPASHLVAVRPKRKQALTVALAAAFLLVTIRMAHVLDLGPLHMPIGAPTPAPFAFILFCTRHPHRCLPSSEIQKVAVDDQKLSELTLIQRLVNRSITFRADPPGRELDWVEGAKVGDCDDFAMTKRGKLLDAGWPSSAVLLAVAAVPSGEYHIVVVVVTDSGDLVLDNLRPNAIRWTRLPYRWIKRSSPQDPRQWNVIEPVRVAELEGCKSSQG